MMIVHNHIPLPHPSFLDKLNLNLTLPELKAKYPRPYRDIYLAVINWFRLAPNVAFQPLSSNPHSALQFEVSKNTSARNAKD